MRDPDNNDWILRGTRPLLSPLLEKTVELEFALGAQGVGTGLDMARTVSGINTMPTQRAGSSS